MLICYDTDTHIKGSKECLFVMTQTHSLQICNLCVIKNKYSFESFKCLDLAAQNYKNQSHCI